MTSMTYLGICAGLLASLGSSESILAKDRTFVPVASYLNRRDLIEKEGKRAATILAERKIPNELGDRFFDETAWGKWTAIIGSDSAVIFVPKDDATEARLLLARAVKAEGLRITLRDDNGAPVSLESIFEPSKKQGF